MMMMTQFNLQPPIKNTNTASKREAPQQSLHVEIQGVYAKEIAPHIAPLQEKIKWYAIIEKIVLSAIVLVTLAFFLPPIIGSLSSIQAFSSVVPLLQKQPGILLVPVIGVLTTIFSLRRWLGGATKKQLPFQSKLFEWLVGNDYQTLIIKPLLKHLSLSLTITPHAEFPQGIYKQSNLFTKKYDRFFGSELVTDNRQRDFTVGFIHTEYYEKSGENSEWITIFRGLMIQLPCPKAISGQTFIFPDAHEKKWGEVAKQLQGMTNHAGAKLVTMDNPDFEKAFKVYTTDSVQAHYLLSTKWLEKLTDFQKELNLPISIALHSGICYVALHGYESPFTPQQELEKALTASGVYTQFIRLKKLFDQLAILQQIGSTFNDG